MVPIILTQCGLHFSLAFDFCPVGAAEHFTVTVCAGTEVGSTYGWLLRGRGYSLLIFPSTYITLTSCLGSNPNLFSYPRLQKHSFCLNVKHQIRIPTILSCFSLGSSSLPPSQPSSPPWVGAPIRCHHQPSSMSRAEMSALNARQPLLYPNSTAAANYIRYDSALLDIMRAYVL